MQVIADLLTEIETYTRARNIAESTFGRLAVNDGKFVGRLRSGSGVTVRLIEKARAYMRTNPPSEQRKTADPDPDRAAS